MSSRRRVTVAAISEAGTPRAPISTASSASTPSPIDADIESMTWISRSLNIAAPISADLIVPDSVPATWIDTIASAPSSNARW